LGRVGFGLGIETAFSLMPPPIFSPRCGSSAVGAIPESLIALGRPPWLGPESFIALGRASVQLFFLRTASLAQRCSQRSFGAGAKWFHIFKPCYPGSGWRRQLWPARYPGLGDCWGLVGVGEGPYIEAVLRRCALTCA
jgi:hypothetical protein